MGVVGKWGICERKRLSVQKVGVCKYDIGEDRVGPSRVRYTKKEVVEGKGSSGDARPR
jgi:hypothetical protein